jgi:predicted transcriptional regulator
MKVFCEVMLNQIFPALRASLAREMIKKFKMSQKEVAKYLGVSQPAISYYKNNLRGKSMPFISKEKAISIGRKFLEKSIKDGTSIYFNICNICKEFRKEAFGKKMKKDFLCLIEINKKL